MSLKKIVSKNLFRYIINKNFKNMGETTITPNQEYKIVSNTKSYDIISKFFLISSADENSPIKATGSKKRLRISSSSSDKDSETDDLETTEKKSVDSRIKKTSQKVAKLTTSSKVNPLQSSDNSITDKKENLDKKNCTNVEKCNNITSESKTEKVEKTNKKGKYLFFLL